LTPVVGPAKTTLAATGCSDAVIVPPAPVIGLPVTANNIDGRARATEVTVPVAAVFVARPISPSE
jgi:hypothetical protein